MIDSTVPAANPLVPGASSAFPSPSPTTSNGRSLHSPSAGTSPSSHGSSPALAPARSPHAMRSSPGLELEQTLRSGPHALLPAPVSFDISADHPSPRPSPPPMHQTAGNGGGGYGNYERLESEHLKAFSQQFLQPGTQPVQEAQQPPLEFIALPTMIPPSTQPTQNPPMPTPMPAASLKPNQPYQPYPTSATNSTAALYPGVSADQLPTPPVKRVRVASRNRIWICGVLLIAVAVAVTVGVVTSKKNDDKAPPGGGGSSSGSGGGGGGGSSSLSPEYWDCRSKCSDTLEQCRNVCESQQEYKTCISNCAGNFTCESQQCKFASPCFNQCSSTWGTCAMGCK